MAGIKESKEALDFVLSLASAVGKAVEDGEVSFGDVMHFVGPLRKAGDAFENGKGILPELKDLDAAERAELLALAKEKLDLPNDELEAMVEKGFDAVDKLYEVVMLFLK
jgi:hypothetical protein